MTLSTEEQVMMFDDDDDFDAVLKKTLELDALDMAAGEDASVKKRWTMTLSELADVLEDELQRMGQSAKSAYVMSRRLIARQAHHLGGRMMYLPRDDTLRKGLRDIEIYKQYTGNNSADLGLKFELTQRSITEIVREQHAINRARIQRKLPL